MRTPGVLARVAAYGLAWTVAGLFLFSRDLARRLLWHDSTPWQALLASWLLGAYISAALTPVVFWLGRRWPIERERRLRRVALHLLASAVFSVLQLALEAAASVWLGIFATETGSSFVGLFSTLMVLGFHGNVLIYWALHGMQAGWRFYWRFREREQEALRLQLQASELRTELVRAQLSALKMQLQPHFLFNTLNAVVVLVRQQKGREAEDTLARLSDLLRWVLEDVGSQEVPLRRELEYLRLYLAIEQTRFQDRLRVDLAIAPDVLDARVPHMGLQPLVENAIRHGIERRAAAGRVSVRASREDGLVRIDVEDDGPGFSTDAASDSASGAASVSGGIGLANTRARLVQLYGEAASLATGNREQGGAVVTMRLPYRLENDDADGESHACS
jgi:two-component system, LytTR family, sensor kinase